MDETVKNESSTQSENSVQEQQQAYVEAMKQIKKEEKQVKNKKRRIKLCVVVAIIAALCIFAVMSYNIHSASDIGRAANSQKYLPISESQSIESYKNYVQETILNYIGDKDPSDERIQSALIEQAQSAMDNGSYYGAYLILENCAENGNATEIINECNYRITLACIEEGHNATAWIYSKKLDNYKNSDALEIWLHYNTYAEVQYELLKSTVQASCKDPSSFKEEYGSRFYARFRADEKSETGYVLGFKMELAYSATNSFGGRIRDTYETDFDYIDFEIHEKSIEEADGIVKLSKEKILEESE